MKQLFTLLIILTAPCVFGQIKEVDIPKKELIGKLSFIGERYVMLERYEDNTVVFTYKDTKFSHITEYKSFSFKDVDGSLDDFYNTLMEGVKEKKKQTKRLELPDDILNLEFGKSFGQGFVNIYHHPKGLSDNVGRVVWMNKKRLKKLFDK